MSIKNLSIKALFSISVLILLSPSSRADQPWGDYNPATGQTTYMQSNQSYQGYQSYQNNPNYQNHLYRYPTGGQGYAPAGNGPSSWSQANNPQNNTPYRANNARQRRLPPTYLAEMGSSVDIGARENVHDRNSVGGGFSLPEGGGSQGSNPGLMSDEPGVLDANLPFAS